MFSIWSQQMTKVFPPIKPNRSFYIQVDNIHKLYVEESGNIEGQAVVYLHGGPGAGSDAFQRQLFDPVKYRIILFDQRGSGKSQPHAELQGNTTQNLIEDMEKIREHLALDSWVVSGGSWGATLSLAYAQSHPDRVAGLIVRGIFLSTQYELNWLYKEGASRFFPEQWKKFVDYIPEPEQEDLLLAYHKRLTSDNELLRRRSAKVWVEWEARLSSLLPNNNIVGQFSVPHTAASIARIEAHYFINASFLKENQLIENIQKIRKIPGYIVHGRYDMICPVEQAYKLHDAWPRSELFIAQAAGHSVSEPGIRSALVEAGNLMLKRLGSLRSKE